MTKILPPINISRTKELSHDVYRYAYNSDSRITQKLADFYKEGVKCPSVAKVIAEKATLDGIKHYGDMTQEDIRSLRGNPFKLILGYLLKTMLAFANIESEKNKPEIKEYYDVFQKEFSETLYPTTYKIREQIIKEKRVTYGKVTPKQPLSLKKRFQYAKLFDKAKQMKSHS